MKIKIDYRAGRKQIIAFLNNEQIQGAYDYAIKYGLTNQEVISLSINKVLQTFGKDEFMTISHEKIKRRLRGKAKVRIKDAKSRIGTRSFSGWFNENDVMKLHDFSLSSGLTIQNIIERGVFLLTNKPYDTFEENNEYDDGVVGD